jgi:anti-sigma regulatory factor (Ser/Thr protein kinase)
MVRLTLPAVLSSVDRVRSFLQESLSPLDPREDDFFKIELAVVELCVNIARYAYPDCAGEMAIEIETDDRTATVTITDNGIPFDPRSVPKPDVSWILATGRTGGLGIYLARTLTDRFDYRREAGRNVLTLAKRF